MLHVGNTGRDPAPPSKPGQEELQEKPRVSQTQKRLQQEHLSQLNSCPTPAGTSVFVREGLRMSQVPLPAQTPQRHAREEESCARGWGGKGVTGTKGKGSSPDPSPLPPRSSSGTSTGTMTHPEGSWHIPAPSFTNHTAPSMPRDSIWDASCAAPPAGVPTPGQGSCWQGQELCSWVKGTQNQRREYTTSSCTAEQDGGHAPLSSHYVS